MQSLLELIGESLDVWPKYRYARLSIRRSIPWTRFYALNGHKPDAAKDGQLYFCIVIVPLGFQKIVWATCPHISSSTSCMFWPPAWWALRLHWWPLAQCSNASMYPVLISTNVFVPVSLLYSVGNKTYYYYCDFTRQHFCWLFLHAQIGEVDIHLWIVSISMFTRHSFCGMY